MGRLVEMESFASVVDMGGFTEAGRKMGLSKSSVSKHVSALETRLGARLLNRTTRRVMPTEIGLAYYDRARHVLDEAGEADAMVTSMQATPKGSLRICVDNDFGSIHLSKVVGEFLLEYPDIDINMVLNTREADMSFGGFDLVIRAGDLQDSTWRSRKLLDSKLRIVGSPAYLKANGTPILIDDLFQHRLLHYSNNNHGNVWRLKSPAGETRQVRARGSLTANDGQSLLQAAEAGLGLAYLPGYLFGDALKNGRLVSVMDDHPIESVSINVISPPGHFVPSKLRAFIEYLDERFKNGPVIG